MADARHRLWRGHNRGESASRAAERELTSLRGRLKSAVSAQRERSVAEAELLEVQDRANERRAELERIERDLADGRILAELSRLERASEEIERIDLTGLDGPLMQVDPADLAREVAAAAKSTQGPRHRLAQPPIHQAARDLALLEHQDHIGHLPTEEAQDRHDVEAAERHGRAARAALERRDELLAGLAVEPGMSESALKAPRRALRAAALAWRDEFDAARTAAEQGGRLVWPAILVALAGAALVALFIAGLVNSLLGSAGLLLLVLSTAWLSRRRPTGMLRLAGLYQAPTAVRAAAEGAGISPAVLARPETLIEAVGTLDEAREAASTAGFEIGQVADIDRRRAERLAGWRALAKSVGVAVDLDAPGSVLPRALGEALARARGALQAAERDSSERAEATRAQGEAEAQHTLLAERERQLHAGLQRALPRIPDIGKAWTALGELSSERSSLEGERRSLAREPRFAQLECDPRRTPPPGESAFWSPEQQAERGRHHSDVALELDHLRGLEGELRERARGTLPAAAAELAAQTQQLERSLLVLRRKHDRLALMERALLLGERRFRAQHQPDVLRVASAHLECITEGRYGRIDYPDPEDRVLQVYSRDLGELIPVGPPLSRGVREQVHLCLRLGTLEHLDRGREPLPLVLDEALVHWDPPRRAALYKLLRPLTQQRQILLMTCQPEFAREAELLLNARLVSLSDHGTVQATQQA